MYGYYSWLSGTGSWSEYSGTIMALSVINSGGGLWVHFTSLHFSRPVVSDSLRSHRLFYTRLPCPSRLFYTRLPCPSPTPRAYSNSYPLSWWCHPTISSSVILFSHLQSFPASASFPVISSYQVVKVLEFQLQHQSFQWIFGLISLGLTGWISLQSKGLSRVFSNTTVQKHQFFGAQFSL